MQILKNKTHIDFIGKRKIALFVSSVVNLAIIVGIAIFGFNFGVDFAGGTVVELKFQGNVSAEDLRKRAQSGGLHDVSVQQIGPTEENSYLLRLGGVTQLTKESAEVAKTTLEGLGGVKVTDLDLDNGIINFRSEAKPVTETEQKEMAEKFKKAVVGTGLGVSEVRFLGSASTGGSDYQLVASGMAERITSALSAGMEKPDFVQQRVEYVGPQVGKQLRNKGIMSLIYAMVAILIYVAFRFDFKFGPGALLAMLHDVVMVAGYFLISRREFNLTSIAVLLTVIGYSINDTIVIYDRIREEMARYKGKPLAEIINIAINDTLARTILTSGVTALSLVGLLIFGVGEIFDFAMAMLIGILVGTYSSVYIASPLVLWLDKRADARASVRKATA